MKAVFFDLDGVLFDSEPLHRSAWIKAMAEFEISLDDEYLMPWTGIPCADLAKHLSRTRRPERDWRVYRDAKGAALQSLARTELIRFEGVVESVRRVASRVPAAYVTSNIRPDAELMLEAAGFDGIFGAGVCYEDVESPKPSPEPYLRAARLIGVDPTQCCVIEDSPSGVESGIRAGMLVLGVTSSFSESVIERANRIFRSTVEACAWILGRLDNRENAGT